MANSFFIGKVKLWMFSQLSVLKKLLHELHIN